MRSIPTILNNKPSLTGVSCERLEGHGGLTVRDVDLVVPGASADQDVGPVARVFHETHVPHRAAVESHRRCRIYREKPIGRVSFLKNVTQSSIHFY